MTLDIQPDVRARWDNGLEGLHKEVHNVLMASSSLWYQAGSGSKHPGRMGTEQWVAPLRFLGTPVYSTGVPDHLIAGNYRQQILDTIQRYTKLVA